MAKSMARININNIVINVESWDDCAPETNTLKTPIGAVTIGDVYNPIDGRFYRDGKMILTDEQIIADARAALEILGVNNE